MFPLLRPGCDSLVGSNLRAAVTVTSAERPLSGQEDFFENSGDVVRSMVPHHKQRLANSLTFPVQLMVEKAARLQAPPLSLPNSTVAAVSTSPRYYVTVDTVECAGGVGSFVTPLASTNGGNQVTWLWEQQARLDKEVFKREDKALQFKVWQRPAEIEVPVDLDALNDSSDTQRQSPAERLPQDKLVGFSSVDLAPLTAGLRQLLGWYHITDYRGEVHGQLKVGVTPFSSISPDKTAITQFEQFTEVSLEDGQSARSLHNRLQERVLAANPSDTSRSILLNNLHGHLADLDALNRRLNARLANNDQIDRINDDVSIKDCCVESRLPPLVPRHTTVKQQLQQEELPEEGETESGIEAVLRRARELLNATEEAEPAAVDSSKVMNALSDAGNSEMDSSYEEDAADDILQVCALNDDADVDSFHGPEGADLQLEQNDFNLHWHSRDIPVEEGIDNEYAEQLRLAKDKEDVNTSDSLQTEDLLWENEVDEKNSVDDKYFQLASSETLTPLGSVSENQNHVVKESSFTLNADQEIYNQQNVQEEFEATSIMGASVDDLTGVTVNDDDLVLEEGATKALNQVYVGLASCQESFSLSGISSVKMFSCSYIAELSSYCTESTDTDSRKPQFHTVSSGSLPNVVATESPRQMQRYREQAAAARAVLCRLERAVPSSPGADEQLRPLPAPPESLNSERLMRILTTKFSAAGGE